MKYCEDAVFWERVDNSGVVVNKVLLLSCDPNRKAWNTVMGPLHVTRPPSGALWYLRHGRCCSKPRRIALEGYPDGARLPSRWDSTSIFREPNEPYSNLFVVNHARNNSTIEQFALAWHAPDRARWVRTLSGPELVAPNALALTSPTSFYLTHDHRFTTAPPRHALGKVLPLAESILALPLAWTTHVSILDTANDDNNNNASMRRFRPMTHTTVAPYIPFANGVAISPDGMHVADRVDHALRDALLCA
jgi:hypothetical protein